MSAWAAHFGLQKLLTFGDLDLCWSVVPRSSVLLLDSLPGLIAPIWTARACWRAQVRAGRICCFEG
jgi:hypothetical protein